MERVYHFLLCVLLITTVADYSIAAERQNGPETNRCLIYLLHHVSPPETLPGTIVAARSKQDPNYWYHWTRDAALVMRTLAEVFGRAQELHVSAIFSENFRNYIELTRVHQSSKQLGEPKFEVDGSPFTGEWGRPQNDGPALRAIAVMRWIQVLQEKGLWSSFEQEVFPANEDSVLVRDLDYVARHWRESSFDIWEEVSGDHFYNRIVQASALHAGADFFQETHSERADLYRTEANAIRQELEAFIDPDLKRYRVSINQTSGLDYKSSALDTAILLAALHAEGFSRQVISFSDSLLLNTFYEIDSHFADLYAVNQQSEWERLGTAIGRYPEDRYDGHRTDSSGNPWFLTTLAMAEFLYHFRDELLDPQKAFMLDDTNIQFVRLIWPERDWTPNDQIEFSSPEFEEFIRRVEIKAQSYFDRVHLHWAQGSGSEQMSEQINRDHGFMQGAEDLTWSYSAYLRASLARRN